jgi:cysteine synthase B
MTAPILPTARVDLPVGHTPLVRLRRIPGDLTASVHVKCEWVNPAGSVKDRPALRMILDAESRGLLDGGRSLLDSTSGNTGIALAQLAAARGHAITLCVPANTNVVRLRLLRVLGASLVLTDPLDGADGARAAAHRMATEQPDRFAYLDQYSNPQNWRAHYETTAMEIWEQTGGKLTHFVAIMGTSGTFGGVSRRLRELNPDIQRVAVQPDAAYHGIEGAKHYASTEVPPIFDASLPHRIVEVATEDAQEMSRRLAREEGLPAGVSGGAAVVAALRMAREAGRGLVVAVIPDSIQKTLAEAGWEDRKP